VVACRVACKCDVIDRHVSLIERIRRESFNEIRYEKTAETKYNTHVRARGKNAMFFSCRFTYLFAAVRFKNDFVFNVPETNGRYTLYTRATVYNVPLVCSENSAKRRLFIVR